MAKRIAVVGRGTAGALSVPFMLRLAPNCEVHWHYDPSIAPQAVGEGSTLHLPRFLQDHLGFKHSDLRHIDGTLKAGIEKEGWGVTGAKFHHDFPCATASYHFSATGLQDYIHNAVADRVTIKEHNVKPEHIDADYVIDCTGTPPERADIEPSGLFVNAAYVVQCPWERPEFLYTLSIARPHGWVFGIPLQNRCSIGYMYNKDISTVEQVQDDINVVLDSYGLRPSDKVNSFSFHSYFRKEPITRRVAYNGNASFFLEPLEATSIATILRTNLYALEYFFEHNSAESININYNTFIAEVKSVIAMHYLRNGTFDTPFWRSCEQQAKHIFMDGMESSPLLGDLIKNIFSDAKFSQAQLRSLESQEAGTWNRRSFIMNIDGMGLSETIKSLLGAQQ